ncbi:MAG: hypothetical protein GYB67_00865 [Chloroflexi bacterium]|nr:hypothetical protein [Chloroflexota bacterium]
MARPILHYVTTLPLAHAGDCSLLGVTPAGTLYVEEIYSEAAWLAQHALNRDGTLVLSIDEDYGAHAVTAPLALPVDIVRPQRAWQTMRMNFSGARHRGLRGPERLLDLLRPLTVHDKMTLAALLDLDPTTPLLGLAEYYVLAEAALAPPNLYVVCARVRLAYALPEAQIDADGEPYDYDTRVWFTAQVCDRTLGDTPSLMHTLADLPSVELHRPMDCLVHANQLYVADGGADDRVSCVHIWQIEHTDPPLTREEAYLKRLYG